MNLPKLDHQMSVVLCSWKNPELLKQCLRSIRNTVGLDTQVFVALNEGDKESIDYLCSYEIPFVVAPDNYGTLAVDFLIPWLKSEYTIWINDDSIFSYGWDCDMKNLIDQYYPAAAQIRGVEKRFTDGRVALSDLSLPDFTDDSAFDSFNANVTMGKYKCDLLYGLFHPICCKTKDFLAVGGVSDGFDFNWWPGHSMDTYFAYKLWKLNPDYKFLISNTSFYYHGSSLTNKKLKATNPEADNRHNSEYFLQKTGMTHKEFHKIVKYGERVNG